MRQLARRAPEGRILPGRRSVPGYAGRCGERADPRPLALPAGRAYPGWPCSCGLSSDIGLPGDRRRPAHPQSRL